MQRNRIMLLVFAAGLLVGVVGSRMIETIAVAETEPADAALAKVVQVNHGDEFEIMWRPPVAMRFNVRLNRVDAPFKDNIGGKQAAEHLASMIYGKHVRIEFEDPDSPYQDRSERMIAYAHINGKNVGIEMVRSGWAEFFTQFGQGKYAEAFIQAQNEAKAAKRGLWSDEKPIAPQGE